MIKRKTQAAAAPDRHAASTHRAADRTTSPQDNEPGGGALETRLETAAAVNKPASQGTCSAMGSVPRSSLKGCAGESGHIEG